MQFNEAGDYTRELHYIGKSGNDGIDLGDGGAFENNVSKRVQTLYLISEEDLSRGLELNINAGVVTDIDDTDIDRRVYAKYGYQ